MGNGYICDEELSIIFDQQTDKQIGCIADYKYDSEFIIARQKIPGTGYSSYFLILKKEHKTIGPMSTAKYLQTIKEYKLPDKLHIKIHN
ncbi:MAG: hypothetical protein PHP76_04860 [Bacteroidales bacterium]|nr:hypothetical protein [Bacteroidales bacterium]